MKFSFVLILAFISFVFSTPGFAQEDEVIKIDSSLVVVNATITDASGKPVGGLKKNQFNIFEDGKLQEVEFFEAESTPFAAVILIDTSGSMEARVSVARSAAIGFLDGLRLDDVASIYNFDSKVSLVQEFSNSRDLLPAVYDLKAYGFTVLNDAIFKAAEELSRRPEKRRAIVVLSDGMDTKSKRSADKALRAALAANATIYTVDMSAVDTGGRERMQNQGVLKNFAEKSGGKFIPTPGGAILRQAFKNIVAELGNQYTLGYQPANLKKDGKWRVIEVKTSKPDLIVRSRKGYHAQNN